MPLAAGARLGPYEIISALGAGGMGEVYRARDTKLGREVAIKILPSNVIADTDRVARFSREAQILASLNHPNIASIFHLEEADGVSALVLELVEGETLAERIARGPIPIDEAIPIARQMCEALEASHEHGIIHRDLKPANIKITPDGNVKVLDFGLAKLTGPPEGGPYAFALGAGFSRPNVSLSPTITSPAMMTGIGMLLGTAAYMAPEQAKGKPADKRSDIWAFGCVLYEMLTGIRPFATSDVTETLAAILMRDPDWRALPAKTPSSVSRLLHRCLEKDLHERLRDIGDARLDLKDAAIAKFDEIVVRQRPSGFAWMMTGASLVVAVLGLGVAFLAWRAVPNVSPTRLDVTTTSTTDPFSFALSPDGRTVAFVANGEKGSQLWLRPFEVPMAYPLGGTQGASYPFWSPDGQSLGCFSDGRLNRIDLRDRSTRILANAPQPRGGTWNADDVILFAASATSGLMRVSAAGGTPVPVTHVAPGQLSHRWPQFLPDGRRFIFSMALGQVSTHGVYVASLDGGEPKRILAGDTQAAFAPPRYLLRVVQGVLVSQGFDAEQGGLIGDPVPLAQGVGTDDGLQHSAFSVSASDVVAYRSGAAGLRQIVWVDRSGKIVEKVGRVDQGSPANPELAPDGRRIAF